MSGQPWIVVRTGHPIDVIKDFFSYCGEIQTVIQNNYDYFIQFVYHDALVTARLFVGSEIMHKDLPIFVIADPSIILEMLNNVPPEAKQSQFNPQTQLCKPEITKGDETNRGELVVHQEGSEKALTLPPLTTAVAMTGNRLQDLDKSLLNIGPDVVEGVSLISDLSMHLLGKAKLSVQELDSNLGVSQSLGEHPVVVGASTLFADVDSRLALSENMSSLYTYLSQEATEFKAKTEWESQRLRIQERTKTSDGTI